MPFIKETCEAGRTKDFYFFYSRKYRSKETPRVKKKNKTKEAQKKVNDRQAIKNLTRILNANFWPGNPYITFKYEVKNRPKTKEELRDDINKLLRALRKLYKKHGSTLNYVWVAERGIKGATHIHMVLNDMDTKEIQKLWTKGFISTTPLSETGQYRRLANYFVKYAEQTAKSFGETCGKKYNPSQNLKRPIPDKKKITTVDAYSTDITAPPGWYLDKDSVEMGVHEVTGYTFLSYTFVKT